MRRWFLAGFIPVILAIEDPNALTTVSTTGSTTPNHKHVTDVASTARPSPHNERIRQRDSASTTCHIYPASPSDADTNRIILDSIKGIKNLEQDSVKQFGSFDLPHIVFWQVPLDEEGKTKMRQTPGVELVRIPCSQPGNDCDSIPQKLSEATSLGTMNHNGTDRADQFDLAKRAPIVPTSSPNALDEMTFLSTYPATGLNPAFDIKQYGETYVYDRSAGRDVTVYIMSEKDAVLNSPEFDDIKGTQGRPKGDENRIIYLGKTYGGYPDLIPDPPPDDPQVENAEHGTQVLSKVVGKAYGAAKNVKTVMARYPNDPELEELEKHAVVLERIRRDWRNRKAQSPSGVGIISMSVAWDVKDPHHKTDTYGIVINRLKNQFNLAINEGLLPVVAAGNDDSLKNAPIGEYPQLFAGLNNWEKGQQDFETPPVPLLLVVGAVDKEGRLSAMSKSASYVNQYAPGVSIKVADIRNPSPQDPIISGTSLAAPAVAGVAAYLAGLSSVYDQWNAQNLDAGKRVEALYKMLVEPARVENSQLVATTKWPRNYHPGDSNFPDAIWNQIRREHYLPFCQTAPTRRSQDSTEDKCPLFPSDNSTSQTNTTAKPTPDCSLSLEETHDTSKEPDLTVAVDLQDLNRRRVAQLSGQDPSHPFNITAVGGPDVQIQRFGKTVALNFNAVGNPQWSSDSTNETSMPHCMAGTWTPRMWGQNFNEKEPSITVRNMTCNFLC